MYFEEKCCPDIQPGETCTAYTYQSASVSVPVTIVPRVKTGNITTVCCGEPKVRLSPYNIVCSSKSVNCSFILMQNICIEIPIEISADTIASCPTIACGEASSKMCEDCGG
ncbi:MAG: hypothetical protein EOM51_04330 [Clostridia bacterium]|nr:hypothetical protein [Clostridia bacterium]